LGEKVLAVRSLEKPELVVVPINFGDKKQQWYIEGDYIVNKANDLVITVIDEQFDLVSKVSLSKRIDGAFQKWILQSNPGTIECKGKGGLYLSIHRSSADDAVVAEHITPAPRFFQTAVVEYPITLVNDTDGELTLKWGNAPDGEQSDTKLPSGSTTLPFYLGSTFVITDQEGHIIPPTPYVVSKTDTLQLHQAQVVITVQLADGIDLTQGDVSGNISVISLAEAKRLGESKFANPKVHVDAATYNGSRAHYKVFSKVVPREFAGAVSLLHGVAVNSFSSPDHAIVQVPDVDVNGGDVGEDNNVTSLEAATKLAIEWLSTGKADAALYSPNTNTMFFKNLLQTLPCEQGGRNLVAFIYGSKV